MVDWELPESGSRQELMWPLLCLASVDSMEYAGVVQPEEAAPARRKIIEAETTEEAGLAVMELMSGLSAEEEKQLKAISGEEFHPVAETLFNIGEGPP